MAQVTVIASPKPPDAFLSYTRFDDQRERGKISQLRRELADEVRAVTGELFEIFQDVEGIGIGEHWSGKLDQMLDEARFFIPILTPSYFSSPACRDELEKFLGAEAERGRNDLVLPIYYIECPVLEDPNLRAGDPLAGEIHGRQRHDWRKLRFSTFSTKVVKTALHKLALEIVRARRRPIPEATAPQTSAEVQVSALQRRRTVSVAPLRPVALPRRADVKAASTEVEYNGTKFTSPVEAQWAVFFDTVGLKYLYKAVEFDIGGGVSYSPDFWLPELSFWLEVKIDEPTDEEKSLWQRVADTSNCTGLIAIGAPEPRDQLLAFSPSDSSGEFPFPYQEYRFYFADDRRNEGEFWLLSDDGAGKSIGPRTGPDHGRDPGLYGATRLGYEAARNARLEHGETRALPSPSRRPMPETGDYCLSQLPQEHWKRTQSGSIQSYVLTAECNTCCSEISTIVGIRRSGIWTERWKLHPMLWLVTETKSQNGSRLGQTTLPRVWVSQTRTSENGTRSPTKLATRFQSTAIWFVARDCVTDHCLTP